jgi:hypothetical protein
MSAPLRKVVKVRFLITKYNRPGEGTNEFTLECGHQVLAKQSAGDPKMKRCRECWRSGLGY